MCDCSGSLDCVKIECLRKKEHSITGFLHSQIYKKKNIPQQNHPTNEIISKFHRIPIHITKKKKNEPLEKRFSLSCNSKQKANVQLSSKKCDVIGNQK